MQKIFKGNNLGKNKISEEITEEIYKNKIIPIILENPENDEKFPYIDNEKG